LEVSFDTNPWSFEDITEAIEQQAKSVTEAEKKAHQLKQANVIEALAVEIERRQQNDDPVIGKREAEEFLYEGGELTRAEIRRLIDAHDINVYKSAGRWRIDPIPGAKGNKKGIFCLIKNHGANNTPTDKPIENNDLFFPYLRRPCAMRSAQITGFSAVENKGVTGHHICAVPFRDAVRQSDLGTTMAQTSLNAAAQIPLKNGGANASDDNASKINGEKDPYLRRADDRRTAQIPDFEDEENQQLANGALFAPSETKYTESEDDLDFMISDPSYARAAQKRPGADR
jgi:hypothetical protein